MAKRFKRAELKEALYRRRYLVPNLVTLGNLFCGFLTIIYATSGRFGNAVIAIAIAILLDGIDGRIARRLNATSQFGLEFDSFSDLVSFGVAPAILVYQWAFLPLADEFGVFITFVFAVCAASRLARFNIASENLQHFIGLPTPAAAGVIAATINYSHRIDPSLTIVGSATVLMLLIAGLMVSETEYPSIKKIKLRGMNFKARIALAAIIAIIWYNTQVGFLVLAWGYALSGPLLMVRSRVQSAKANNEE
jgi:CDP-diacylglycerol--serine O-phosphatidyltransferase